MNILKHPKAMAAMMKMVKFDIAALEAAAQSPENLDAHATERH